MWLTFSQVAAFSSPGRGSLQQPSCLETSGLRQHYWFEIQQIAIDLIWKDPPMHCITLPCWPEPQVLLQAPHWATFRWIHISSGATQSSQFESTFCLLWSSVGAPSKGIFSSSCSCRAVGCTWLILVNMVDIEDDDDDDYTEDDNYGNIDDDYGND